MAAATFAGSMRLLFDTKSNRVLFAEARKETVDFLFHLLSLPIATVISLVREHDEMVGSVSNLYTSIENLHDSYILPQHSRLSLLNPILKPCACSVPMLKLNGVAAYQKKFYKCDKCSGSSYSIAWVTDDPGTPCPTSNCDRKMDREVNYAAPPVTAGKGGGFVKDAVTYMVTDNLEVSPMSTVSCITLLNRFSVKDVSVLQEKIVDFGYAEAVKLLKASLHSKQVLTEIFLPKIDEPVVIVKEELVQQAASGDNDAAKEDNQSKNVGEMLEKCIR